MLPKKLLGIQGISVEAEYIEIAGDLAEESFNNGFLCAESVVMALANIQQIESEHLPKVATAFCSGMARTCGTCGVLTGAMIGLSLGLGRSSSGEQVQPIYSATQRLITEFETEFGAKDCHVLLGCDIGTQDGQAMFKERQLRKQCTQYTRKAAEITATILAEKNT